MSWASWVSSTSSAARPRRRPSGAGRGGVWRSQHRLPIVAPLRPGRQQTHASGDSGQAAEGPTGVRSGCLLGVGLFALGAVLAVAFVAFSGRGEERIALGSPEGLRPGSVVYHATDHVFVVRLVDGSALVLSDLDPHNPPGRQTCRVTYRPDLGSTLGGSPVDTPSDTLSGLEDGRFYDVCSGALYDVEGRGLQGDGFDLRPVPFELDAEGQLTISKDEAALDRTR